LIEDNTPSGIWKLAKILTLTNKSAHLRTSGGGETNRALQQLYPLELNQYDEEIDSENSSIDKNDDLNENSLDPNIVLPILGMAPFDDTVSLYEGSGG
jgi:hypothetical protein